MRLDELAVAADPMTSLPPIPDEAWNAASDQTGQSYAVIRPVVEAVAPHLYAAALRHAADEWDGYVGTDAYGKGVLDTIASIRRLADSAAP